jgi:periplasmic copper chaperone A
MNRTVLASAVAALTLIALALTGHAAEPVRAGSLEIEAPWARASVGTMRPSAAYMVIRNGGERPDRLLRVETPAAGHAEIHATVMERDMMRMRPAEGLEIPPGGELRLEPGGLHVMLMHLQRPLEEGASLPMTLVFERAGEVTIEMPIAALGATNAPD